jgi:acetate kinase
MSDKILTLNSGSTSLKFALFDVVSADRVRAVFKGKMELTEQWTVKSVGGAGGAVVKDFAWARGAKIDNSEVFSSLVAWAEKYGEGAVLGVGHRVVHGGRDFKAPTIVSESVFERLGQLSKLAPLHQPHNLLPIRSIGKIRPDLPQVACFDTAFHGERAPVTRRFALPREFESAGIVRYGFHGLSYEYIAGALSELAPDLVSRRVVVAHLGSGASLCALRNGKSVDTTMGFSPLDGVPMGTRCGAIDPGAVLYLIRHEGMSVAEVEFLLYNRSGLLGVSGLSGDMRTLMASKDRRAVEAIELFSFRVAREIGALATSLGGLDGLVFTAGIGENTPEIRRQICAQIEWLGASLDEAANARGERHINASASRIGILVIPTDEETMIARHTLLTIGNAKQSSQ